MTIKIKYRLTIWLGHTIPKYFRLKESIYPPKVLFRKDHRIPFNIARLEAMQVAERKLPYSYCGIFTLWNATPR